MELQFKRDTQFRKKYFTPDSFAHPAKMNAYLLLWIVENYTKPNETILDPMAGMGTTMLGCTLRRNVVLVELEEKFCNMCKSNWEKVSSMPQLGYRTGECNIVQGDARNLEGLFDSVITSPPYSEGLGHQHRKYGRDIEASKSIQAPEYSRSPDNIGNLPYGQIDKIVTSPPYAETEATQDKQWEYTGKHNYTGRRCKIQRYTEGGNQDNISNLPYGKIDSIITSPPYEAQKTGQIDADKWATYMEKRDIELDRNWGKDRHTEGRMRGIQSMGSGYSNEKDNIGNLKSDSYLEAMLQVYKSCYSVLKPQGLMILVTKNFIRQKQIVRLDIDSIKLCEQTGFSLVERHQSKLPGQSFWRIIYQQKYPDVPVIEHEDILVFRKTEFS